jgi:hypothetical protein
VAGLSVKLEILPENGAYWLEGLNDFDAAGDPV